MTSGTAVSTVVSGPTPPSAATNAEVLLAARPVKDGLMRTELSVPGVHCAGCIRRVETALSKLEGVKYARVNLSTRRVTVRWSAGEMPPPFLETLGRLGYAAHLADPVARDEDTARSELIRALAVAGFAAMNIMLLSVSVWSGAEGATRDLFHWLSALIAIPALAFAGGIYFRSAANALRHGRMNMDVPIAVGVSLAYAMSLYETITHGEHAYFDASVSLLFFLLIGRTLDHVMRERARTAVNGLSRLAARGPGRIAQLCKLPSAIPRYSTASSAWATFCTRMTSRPAGTSVAATFPSGTIARLNPICAASRRRIGACVVARTSPASPTSPNVTTSAGTARPR